MAQSPPVLYRTLRAILRHAVRIFFRRLEIEGLENVPPTGPLLLAPNHPNTFIDVLMTATIVRRRLRFVAKSTVVAIPVLGAFLRMMGVVPIHRKQDGPVDDAMKEANEDVLAGCEQVVADGGAVLIFPEGISSQDEMKLLRLRTGLARIALGAEARAPGEVQIVPVALVYEDPGKFRSAVRVCIGVPIQVAPFAATGTGPDDFGPARAITAAVRDALELDVLHVEDVENEELVQELDLLYGSAIASEAGGRLAASKSLARAVNLFAKEDPARLEQVRSLLSSYRSALDDAGIGDRAVRQRSIPKPSVAQDLFFYLGAPLAFWGFVNHLVFYQVPRFAIQIMQLKKEFDSTVKLLSGVFALLLCYTLQTWAVASFGGPMPAVLYLLSLPVTGVIALLWWEGFDWRQAVAASASLRADLNPEQLADLEKQRATIIGLLDRARVEYLARQFAEEDAISA